MLWGAVEAFDQSVKTLEKRPKTDSLKTPLFFIFARFAREIFEFPGASRPEIL